MQAGTRNGTANQPALAAHLPYRRRRRSFQTAGRSSLWRRLSMWRVACSRSEPPCACDMVRVAEPCGPSANRDLSTSVSERHRATIHRCPSNPYPDGRRGPASSPALRVSPFPRSHTVLFLHQHTTSPSLCQRCHCSRGRRIPSSLHLRLSHPTPFLPSAYPHQLALSPFGDPLFANSPAR